MQYKQFIQSVFKAVDNSDAKGLADFMTEDAVFRFSNNPEVIGKANIIPFLDGFFQSIRGTRHDQIEAWEIPGGYAMNGQVTYTRHDGSTYPCWFANTFKMKDGKIKEYLIFVDNSKLYSN
ncbi:MAG: nuclear transport factor 2 family protein [Bacteroidales bacterium]|nr:nuclear transport factor 2 family protein [Bacteroidales bacterium]